MPAHLRRNNLPKMMIITKNAPLALPIRLRGANSVVHNSLASKEITAHHKTSDFTSN
jgi:hypothetical protein